MRTVKTDAAIYEANRVAAAKAKREARRSQLCPPCIANAQPSPTCPRCLRTFRAPVGLVGHHRINCVTRTSPAVVPPSNSSSSSMPSSNSDRLPEPLLPSTSSSAAPTSAVLAYDMHIKTTRNSDTATNTKTSTIDTRVKDLDCTCPHCDFTFISHIGLVGHLRIHRTKTGEPVPEAPTYTRAFAFTAHTNLAHSCTAWVCSATCASTENCGRQPPAAPRHHILPHHHLTAH
ncbi:hypothetical protein SprV_0802504700 [Sparganum proliferum]